MGTPQRHLDELYRGTDDPWTFRTSSYERARFEATLAALSHARYRHILELGCGNGELAHRLATRSESYTGLDAVENAIISARVAVPEGLFVQEFIPCSLPEGDYDLIVLSEILYFLDADTLTLLANQLDARWPQAGILAVTWLGASGNDIEGEAALCVFSGATARGRTSATAGDPMHRIDRFDPLIGAGS